MFNIRKKRILCVKWFYAALMYFLFRLSICNGMIVKIYVEYRHVCLLQRMRQLDGITDPMDVSLIRLGDSEGQESLACCSSWGHKELDTTQQPNNNNNAGSIFLPFLIFACYCGLNSLGSAFGDGIQHAKILRSVLGINNCGRKGEEEGWAKEEVRNQCSANNSVCQLPWKLWSQNGPSELS